MNIAKLAQALKPYVMKWIGDAGVSPVARSTYRGNMDDVVDGLNYAKVSANGLDEGQVLLSAVAGTMDDIADGLSYGKVLAISLSGGYILLAEVQGDLDDLDDGTNYGKVLVTSITAGKIVMGEVSGDLDDIADGTGYAKVLATQISAGKILLSETDGNLDDIADGSSYGKVLSTSISAGKIVLSETTGDLDDVSDGSTYGRVKTTILGSGFIQVGSGTKDSTLSGWMIDSGEIVGQASGVDQVVLGTDGKITAGAGAVTLDADGIKILPGSVAINRITWTDGTNTPGEISLINSVPNVDLSIDAVGNSGVNDARWRLYAGSYSGGRYAELIGRTTAGADIALTVSDGSATASLTLDPDYSGNRRATIDVDELVVAGGTISTDSGTNAWDLGGYTTTAPTATGYVTIVHNGTTYKLLAST